MKKYLYRASLLSLLGAAACSAETVLATDTPDGATTPVTPPDGGADANMQRNPSDGGADALIGSLGDGSVDSGADARAFSRPDANFDSGAGVGWVAGPTAYLLTETNSLAAPLPNGSGITYDGQELWILASAGSPQPYTLARFNPATSVIDRSFSLGSLFTTLGTSASGITWDGASIWISVAGDTNALIVVDPTTGAISKTMSSPAIMGPTDLDFDGTDLWLSTGTGTAFGLTPSNGGIVQQFNVFGGGRDDGIACRTGELFVGGMFGGLEVYDPWTGTDLGAAVHQDGSAFAQDELGPSVFVGNDLVVLSSLGITYYTTAKAP